MNRSSKNAWEIIAGFWTLGILRYAQDDSFKELENERIRLGRTGKNSRGRNIQRLEPLLNRAKACAQTRQHHSRILIRHKDATGAESASCLPHDVLSHRTRHGSERQAGNNVVGVGQA